MPRRPTRPTLVIARGPAIVSKAALIFDASVDLLAEKLAKYADLSKAGIVHATRPDPFPSCHPVSSSPHRRGFFNSGDHSPCLS